MARYTAPYFLHHQRQPVPSLADIDQWFDNTVLPKRTAWGSDYAPRRFYTTPRGLIKRANTPDPNGLCGDAVSYVFDRLEKYYGLGPTSDGYIMGVALWEGLIQNDSTAVMLPKVSAYKQVFRKFGGPSDARFIPGRPVQPVILPIRDAVGTGTNSRPLTVQDFLNLHVYYLYGKKRTTIEDWWKGDGSERQVTIGKISEFKAL
jgi:hypothetical protein